MKSSEYSRNILSIRYRNVRGAFVKRNCVDRSQDSEIIDALIIYNVETADINEERLY